MKYRVDFNISVEVDSEEHHLDVRNTAETAVINHYGRYYGGAPENAKVVNSGCYIQVIPDYTQLASTAVTPVTE